MSAEPIDWRAVVDEAIRRRKAEGLSQRSLAALAGVSLPTVNSFEQGEIRLRLEKVAAILDVLGLFTAPRSADSIEGFIQASRSRWSSLVSDMPSEHPARRPHGGLELACEISEVGAALTTKAVRDWSEAQNEAALWRAFPAPARWPKQVGEAATENWLKDPALGLPDDVTASDFWRADPDGRLYLRRGFPEDGPAALAPGSIFDLSLPIVHAGAFLRAAIDFAHRLGSSADSILKLRGTYSGLAGRTLIAWANPGLRGQVTGEPQAIDDKAELSLDIGLGDAERDPVTAVQTLLAPLYERFGGFRLARPLVATQLGETDRREGVSIGPFAVTKEMIAGLDDKLLPELLGKLLEAEAAARSIPLSGVELGGHQTAPDGGIDAAIRWRDAPSPGGWLPRHLIYFQCKAQTLAAAAIGREMRPRGELRPLFGELAAANGAYIIVSTDDVGSKGQDERIARMRSELGDLRGGERVHLDFYGADRIARWTNQHLGIALWLLERTGKSLGGWRPFGAWSAQASGETPYLLDETARAVVDNHEGGVREAIASMRGVLSSGGGCVRLVGLSGMGKTRLAEALFDTRILAGKPLAPMLAIYADAGLQLASGAALVAEQLLLAHTEAVLVVDNCTASLHAQLAEIVRRDGSRVALLTIDYDVGDEQPADTLTVRLEPNSDEIVQALLKQRVPRLSHDEIEHIATFSEGNARVALAIARGADTHIDLSRMTDRELIDRLFQADRGFDPDTRRVAEAASLVYAFHVDASDVPVEHPVLASIAGIDPKSFYRHISRLLDWGLAQQRGPQRAIKPDAIANQLAASFLQLCDIDDLLATFEKGPERLFRSFARRLGQLEHHGKAQAIARRLLAPGGRFGRIEALDPAQRQTFLKLAPAAPDAALDAIERSIARRDAELFEQKSTREDVSELLVRLAFDAGRFDRAMEAILELALAEEIHGDGKIVDVRDDLLQRFWAGLAWTKAQSEQRLAFIDRMLDDDRDAVRILGVRALGYMLDAGSISSSFDPTFGSRPNRDEWRPRGSDYEIWIDRAFGRLEEVVAAGGPEANRARTTVARHLRGHADSSNGARAVAAMEKVKPTGYWDAGWREASETLHFGAEGDIRPSLERLEYSLRPRGVDQCFDAFVIGEPWRHWHQGGRENASMRDIALLAKRTGICAVRSGAALAPLIERTFDVEGPSNVVAFGEGLARATPDLDALWNTTYARYAAHPSDGRNAGVLIGIARGADRRDRAWVDARLDDAISDPLLNNLIVYLHSGRDLGSADTRRLILALDQGVEPKQLTPLMFGGTTGPMPAKDLAELLDHMIDRPDGASAALEIFSMRLHGDRQSGTEVGPELRAIARRLVVDPRVYRDERSRSDHELASVARLLFDSDEGAQVAVAICRTMRSIGLKYWNRYEYSELPRLLIRRFPRIVLDEIVAPDTEMRRSGLASCFFDNISNDVDSASPKDIATIDGDILLEWAAEDPQRRAVQLARVIPYSQKGNDGALTWSPAAIALAELAPDPVAVLDEFEARFFSGVSTGPFSSRFVRRLPLIEELVGHKDRRVRQWARLALLRLQQSIEDWDARDRDRGGRFE